MLSTLQIERVPRLQRTSRASRRGPQLPPRQLLWLLYALFLVSGVAQAAIVPLLPRLAEVYDLAPSETALLLALPGLATLAVSVPAGLVADRFGARRATLAAGALLAAACLLQAAPSLALLVSGRILFGVAFGVVWTTGMAWLSEIDTGTKGGRLGPSVTCSSVGVMAGPAVGGILAQQAGLSVPFLLIAAVAALVVAPLALGSGNPPARHVEDPEPLAPRTSVRSLLALIRRPGVAAAAGGLIVSGAVSGVSQLLITIGLHNYGLTTGKIGLAFTSAAVCYIAVSAWTVRLGERARTIRFNAIATLALSLALIPALLGGGPPALVLALLLTAIPRAVVGTVAYSLAAQDGNECSEGFVFGMVNGAWAAAMVVMPLLAGAVDQRGGIQAGFLAVIIPTCALACWLVARSSPTRRRLAFRTRW
ncbi:MAG: MFS transporter [Solirubrobacteraceae bacterium]